MSREKWDSHYNRKTQPDSLSFNAEQSILPYLPSAVHIPKYFSRQVMKAIIRSIKQTNLKSDTKCHLSSDLFSHSEVLLGVSKEAKNLSNYAVEK